MMDVTATIQPTRRPFLPMRFVIGSAVALLAVAYLVYTGLGAATVYYFTVSELQAKGPSGQIVRVGGAVEDGSIVREGAAVRFSVVDGGGRLPVVYGGVIPDIFAAQIDVVVEGRYTAEGVFRATTVLTKCPSRFEA